MRAFLAVAEYGGFGIAARQLNVSQPTISKAVKGLERKLGPLFERSNGRAVALNPVGRLLEAEAGNIIQLLREVERKMILAQDRRPLIRIAIGEYLYNRFQPLLSKCAADNADLNIQLEMISSRSEAFRALRLGEVDIVLASQFGSAASKPRIGAHAIMKVYRSPNVANAGSGPLILPVLEPQEQMDFLAALNRLGIEKTADQIVVRNYFSIKSMCIAGQGRALIFEEDVHDEVEAGLLVEDLPGSIEITRGCFFLGESATLERISGNLISSMI